MEYYIIVYKNTHDAMMAEQTLGKHNFSFRIMPTPTSITQSCGICTRFELKEEVDRIINENIVEYKNIYYKNNDGFELIK
ncbi:MAG: DUF3343 domain-containing protein [Clostridium sp.]|nr:DUF3343 domain-containing protein [Clostridium sp.]